MIYIPDIIGAVVAAMPTPTYYMYGHRQEIANRLTMKDKDSVYKYQKYPLVALRLPVTEKTNDDIHEFELNIAILAFTDKSYIADKRYEMVFKPVLYPLYREFLDALAVHPGMMLTGIPEHDKVDRLFWGVSENEGNSKYLFNDPLDAIELINLKLTVLNSNC